MVRLKTFVSSFEGFVLFCLCSIFWYFCERFFYYFLLLFLLLLCCDQIYVLFSC